MVQTTVTCRACQRTFLVTTEDLNQFEVRCPICGLILMGSQPLRRPTAAPSEIDPWYPTWSQGG